MTNEELIRVACTGLTGGTVDFSVTPRRTSIGRVTLPAGVSSTWTLYASAVANLSNGNWGATPPMKAIVTLLGAGVSVEVEFDISAFGSIVALPASSSIVVDVLPLSSFALVPGQTPPTARVGFQPGGPGASTPILTSPTKTIAGSGGAQTWERPACSTHYRPYSSGSPLVTAMLLEQQTALSTTVLVDASTATTFYGSAAGTGLAREGWLPLHPSTNRIVALNSDVPAREQGVQWLIGLGSI